MSANVETLTDAELSTELDKLGFSHPPVTPTTRRVLERKLAQLLDKKGTPEQAKLVDEDPVETSLSEPAREEDKSKGCHLLLYSGEIPEGLTLKKCYHDKNELHDVLKKLKGARFKWFQTEQEALSCYDDLQEANSKESVRESGTNEANVSKESTSSPSTVALNRFRRLIENGDVEKFKEQVSANPRYLVSAGDAPELLKPGTRYNALHVAVRENKFELCEHIISTIETRDFWLKLYPTDTEDTRIKRRRHVIDLYLNMPDKMANETPLHFACKYGYADIVKLLLGRPEIDRHARNSAGKTAREIICQNNRQSSVAKVIDNLFEEICYVPVYRSLDNSIPPVLGTPCGFEECHSPSNNVSQSPVKPLLVGRAFAGPMSPAKAKDFRKRWRSPSKALESIKRSDAEKGLERVGRHLAYQECTQWTEYWEFIGEFCNFAKPEGLAKLEEYLRGRSNQTDVEDPLDDLTSKLSNVSLTSTLPQQVFLTGPAPTKLDLNVMIALDEVDIEISKYPNIEKWYRQVNSYSEADRMSWQTPKRQTPQLHSPSVTAGAAASYSPLIYRTIVSGSDYSEPIPSLDLNTA